MAKVCCNRGDVFDFIQIKREVKLSQFAVFNDNAADDFHIIPRGQKP